MNSLLMAAAAVLALNLGATAARAACNHEAVETETASDGRRYSLRASSSGANCPTASIRLALLGPSGKPVFTLERVPADMAMLFPPKPGVAAMKEGLSLWTGGVLRPKSTSQLPPWADGGGMKSADIGFAFHPEGLTKASYEALRKANRPMLCLEQGSESFACVLPDGDKPARRIGLFILDQ